MSPFCFCFFCRTKEGRNDLGSLETRWIETTFKMETSVKLIAIRVVTGRYKRPLRPLLQRRNCGAIIQRSKVWIAVAVVVVKVEKTIRCLWGHLSARSCAYNLRFYTQLVVSRVVVSCAVGRLVTRYEFGGHIQSRPFGWLTAIQRPLLLSRFGVEGKVRR